MQPPLTKKDSEFLIYETPDGNIKIDVILENETVWLSQEQMALLFGKGRSTITEHIRNVFAEGELQEEMVCRKFRHTTQHGAIAGKTQEVATTFYKLLVEQYLAFAETMAQQHTPMYMKDWISRLDSMLQLNGRELLTHAGTISHQMALERSNQEYNKYKLRQKEIEKEQSLAEIEDDIKRLAE